MNLEHVYLRPEVNSNQFEISLQAKISLRCEVTSFQHSHDFGRSETHFRQIDRSEISNHSEFSM